MNTDTNDTNTESTESPPVKPGWKTTEFYLSTAALALTVLFASGVLTNATALAIAGMAATVLTALGYKVSRTLVKTAGALLLVVAIGGAALPACASWQPRERAGAGLEALLGCTAPARAAVIADMEGTFEKWVLKHINGDGRTIQLAKLKRDAAALRGEVIGSCALLAALAALATPPPESARSLVAPAPAPDPAAWREALEAVRAELGVGAVRAAGA